MWTSWAAAVAGMTAVTGLTGQLRQLPALHAQLGALGRTRDADRLAAVIDGWNTAARRVLGLNRPDRATGMLCPNHDEPLQQLVQPGDQGQLRYAKLDRHGRPVDPQVTWRHTEMICCRHCDAIWTPDRYMFLGRLVRAADRRRAEAREATDAA